MFEVLFSYEDEAYEYIDLVVHCDQTSFRRRKSASGEPPQWEAQQWPGGPWAPSVLDEIVTELFNKHPVGYSWLT